MKAMKLLASAGAALFALLAFNVSGAAAEPNGICHGTGTLKAQDGNQNATWQLDGEGSCISEPNGMNVTLVGNGTSDSLGLCTAGQLLVTDLELKVFVHWEDVATGATFREIQDWTSPISVYPIATPFLINRPNAEGEGLPELLGVSLHHLTGTCDNRGRAPQATFTWVST